MNKLDLKKNNVIREIIVGKLLGDAHLETQTSGKSWRLKIEHGKKQETYVLHLYSLLSDWVLTPPRQVKKRVGGGNVFFQTVNTPLLRFYGLLFYKKGIKVIPRCITKLLTARALAYWYMDDGSIKSKESKGVFFNTQCYTLDEVKLLCKVLCQKFDLVCSVRKQGKGYQIYISGHSYSRLRELIFPYLLEDMYYKFPLERKVFKR